MGREFVLPWSCKTQDKALLVLKWFVLITSPISLISSILMFGNTFFSPYNWLVILGIMYGLFGILGGWLKQISDWDEEDKFPHFSCKSRNDREVKE